jgi:aminoglycoside phosphotransferase (APT) family kinase protein
MAQTRLSELRARRALAAARLDTGAPVVPIESVTNEVWACGDVVIRLNRRLHNRLQREAEISALLPPEVGYPRIMAVGRGHGNDWVALKRIPGAPLVRAWPFLKADERRRAVTQFAGTLKALHSSKVTPDLADTPDPPQLLQPGPMATQPLVEGLDKLASLPNVDRGVVDELRGYVRANRSALDPFEANTLVHGDLHFQNVLWDGRNVTALLDLEFARAAPPDLDLDVFLRFCAYPSLFVPVGREDEARREDYASVGAWLAEDYPELFAHPRLFDRLRLYSLAFDVKNVLAQPPNGPMSGLTMRHPYRRLMQTVRHESHLDHITKG